MAKGKNGNNEGSIRKRKNGTWEGRYTIGYDARGRQNQLSVYGKTRAEVARKLNEKTAAIQNGTYIIPRDHTLLEWLESDFWVSGIRPDKRICVSPATQILCLQSLLFITIISS